MIELILTLIAAALIIKSLRTQRIRDEQARDIEFNTTIKSLEDKAKREGTFKVSFFDKK